MRTTPGKRDRAGGRSVIGAVGGQDLVAAGVLAGELDGVLVGLGTAVGEEAHLQVARKQLGKLLAEPRADLRGHERIGIGQLLRLSLDRLDHATVAMADVDAHQLAVEVDEALAVRRIEVDPLGALDGDGVDGILRGPLVERVPLGEVDDLCGRHGPRRNIDHRPDPPSCCASVAPLRGAALSVPAWARVCHEPCLGASARGAGARSRTPGRTAEWLCSVRSVHNRAGQNAGAGERANFNRGHRVELRCGVFVGRPLDLVAWPRPTVVTQTHPSGATVVLPPSAGAAYAPDEAHRRRAREGEPMDQNRDMDNDRRDTMDTDRSMDNDTPMGDGSDHDEKVAGGGAGVVGGAALGAVVGGPVGAVAGAVIGGAGGAAAGDAAEDASHGHDHDESDPDHTHATTNDRPF
jgi:hypothetical protein